MSNLKTYRVKADWFDDAEVSLRVNHDILTPELATQINQFWSDDGGRLEQEGGDVVRAVVRLFGSAALAFFMADGGASIGGGGSEYWTDRVIKSQGEGWPDSGALGILICSVFVSSVGYDDVTLESVP